MESPGHGPTVESSGSERDEKELRLTALGFMLAQWSGREALAAMRLLACARQRDTHHTWTTLPVSNTSGAKHTLPWLIQPRTVVRHQGKCCSTTEASAKRSIVT